MWEKVRPLDTGWRKWCTGWQIRQGEHYVVVFMSRQYDFKFSHLVTYYSPMWEIRNWEGDSLVSSGSCHSLAAAKRVGLRVLSGV